MNHGSILGGGPYIDAAAKTASSPIDSAMNRLGESIAGANRSAERLRDRLDGVLMPEPPAPIANGVGTQAAPASDMERRLRDFASGVNALENLLESYLRRLQL